MNVCLNIQIQIWHILSIMRKEMRIIFFFLVMISVYGQQFAQELQSNGTVLGELKIEKRPVQKHFICGASVWRKSRALQKAQRCVTQCFQPLDQPQGMPAKNICQTTCTVVPMVNPWKRITGIRFSYCHYLHWDTKIEMEDAGEGEKTQMKYCPKNYYANGFKTKLTERDGIAGLILNCRNKHNQYQNEELLIFDGEGTWRSPSLFMYFAVGFQVRRSVDQSYIIGLSFKVIYFPKIVGLSFSYSQFKNLSVTKVYINNLTTTNRHPDYAMRQFGFSANREVSLSWSNNNQFLRDLNLKYDMRWTDYRSNWGVHIPGIADNLQMMRRQLVLYKQFAFEKELTDFHLMMRLEQIYIPSCSQVTARGYYLQSQVEIPYTINVFEIGSNRQQNFQVQGVFRGTIFSNVIVETTFKNLQKC